MIHSPPTLVSDDDTSSESEDDSVLPPSTRRPPGRPKNAEFMMTMTRLNMQSVSSSVQDVERTGTHGRHAVN